MLASLPRLLFVFLALGSQVALGEENAVKPASAKFVTCQGCRLNHLPEVRKFIREIVEQGHYIDVSVEYIGGRSPVMYLYDAAGQEIGEAIPVHDLGFEDLHELVQSHGFKLKSFVENEA